MKIFGNGKFYSADDSNNFFKYIGVDKGKIVFAENFIPEKYKNIKIDDLKGKTVVPSFGDTHMHFTSYAYFLGGFDFRNFLTLDDAVSELINFSKSQKKNSLITGFGYSKHSFKDTKLLTKQILDKAVNNKPVFIIKYDGHAGVANSAFIEKLPKKVLELRGFDKDSGWFLNDSFFPAADFAAKSVSVFEMLKRMSAASKELAKYGISFVHSAEGVGYPLDLDVDLARLGSKFFVQDFKVFFQTMNIGKVKFRRLKQIGGCFDTALDGCFGSLDAALNTPYSNDSSNRGILFYKDEQIEEFLYKTHKKNLQTALHAIGDKAVDQCVNSFLKADEKYPAPDKRNILIHGDLISDETMEKAANLNLIFAVQPSFLYWNEEPMEYLNKILGERAKKLIPLRSLIQSGILVTGGSDAPCTQPDPIYGIWASVNHPEKSQRISIFEALKMYTSNASKSGFEENIRGSLKKGLNADFAVLSDDIFECDQDKIKDIKVENLYIKGKKIV
jgi:predicted amidohydrolase YtcJ